MVDCQVSIWENSSSSSKHPRIVQLSRVFSDDACLDWRLSNNIVIVDEDLSQCGILNEGIFRNESGIVCVVPVDLVYGVAVPYGNQQLVLQIITIDWKPAEIAATIDILDVEDLSSRNVQPVKTDIIIQKK